MTTTIDTGLELAAVAGATLGLTWLAAVAAPAWGWLDAAEGAEAHRKRQSDPVLDAARMARIDLATRP